MRPLINIHVIAAFVNPFTSDKQSSLVGCGLKTHDAYSFNVSKRSLIRWKEGVKSPI